MPLYLPPLPAVPVPHAVFHQNGGPDEVNVAGLSGLLADPQTPAPHGHIQAEILNLNTDLAAQTAAINALAASYKTLMTASGSRTAGGALAVHALDSGGPMVASGSGAAASPMTIYLQGSDYPTVNGLSPKLRIRAQLYTNNVAPTDDWTIGLFPFTRPVASGGAGVNIYTIGTVVPGSDGVALTFVNPAVDGLFQAVGTDFALPADGHYLLGVFVTGAQAASSHVHVVAQLQIHNA